MSNLAIINGRVIDPSQRLDAVKTILIRDGKIEKIISDQKIPTGYEKINAKGLVVTSGFIDLHTHLRDPGYEHREDLATGSRAAVAGGFTTIACMANTKPVNDNVNITKYILQKAAEVDLARILPIGAVTVGLEGKTLAPMGSLLKAGCVAFSDDGMPVVSAQIMRQALEYAKTFEALIITHAEEKSLSDGGALHEGEVACRLGLKGTPPTAEEIMIYRDIALAEWVDTRLHVAHVSTAAGIDLIAQAKKRKAAITCEVTPHHLFLTDAACDHYQTNAKVNPPLRTLRDNRALIAAIQDGVVDAIATDHAPHGVDEKQCCFDHANFGLLGMETALPLLLQLVEDRQVSLSKLIALLTIGPASVLNLPFGTLKVGRSADITLFDPKASVTLDADKFASKSRNTPFQGWKLTGKVQMTMVGGKLKYFL